MATNSDDCYFFYYSTCSKGDGCPFRHCTLALGSETTCKNWSEGRCFRPDTCRFRHMEIQKDRSQISCYWETQPGGCRKMHCVFKHANQGVGSAPSNLPDPVSASTPDAAITKKAVPALDQDVSTPSPKIDPIVFNPFEEDSDRESVGISTPKKSVGKTVTPPAGKVGKIKLAKTVPDEDVGLGFAIKSLDELKSEKIAKARQILNEADKLVASQSTFEEESAPVPDTMPKVSSPGRVSAINRLGGAVTRKLTQPAQPTTIRRVQPAQPVQPITIRRVVDSSAGDEDSNDSGSVEEQPRQNRIAVLKEDSGKADTSRRVNLNKGRRIIIADDKVKTDEPVTTTRKVSPKKGGVLSRIGARPDSAPAVKRGDVKARIGTRGDSAPAVSKGRIQSRLGHRKLEPTDATSLDELPGSDIRALELEKAKLTARLMQIENDDSENSGLEDEDEEVPESPSARSRDIPARSRDLPVRSLEDIQREKALESMKQNRLKKVQDVKKEEARPTAQGRKRVLTTRRGGKQEQQIYKPPGAKLKARAEAKAEVPPTSSLRDRLGKRKVSPERVSPSNKSSKQAPSNRSSKQTENSENVPQKKSSWAGWGVKTFSELMREKQQQRLAGKPANGNGGNSNQNNSNPGGSAEGSAQQTNRKPTNRKFTPVVFDDDDTEYKVTTAKRKFTPVVFDAEDKVEVKAQKPTAPKKFKAIVFDNDDKKPKQAPQSVIVKTAPQEVPEKTTPSPRRQLSRQQSNKSVTQETTPPAPPVRKLKRRSSSQISESDTATVKPRRRSSGASRKSSVGEKAPAAAQDDGLDLLDDEFGDLLGDVDVDLSNTSALQHNDDDLLQEMEELLA